MKILTTVTAAIMLLVVNTSLSQEKTKQYDYGKLIFMSPTYDLIVDIGDNKFVVPIVTLKKTALFGLPTNGQKTIKLYNKTQEIR